MENVILLDSVTSTNDHAKNLAAAGKPHGTAVLARQQTAGRGRMGRSFLSPEGGLYLSVILRPQVPAAELLHLTPVLAVSACDAVEEVCGVRPGVKWINDLVLEKKKLAGILTELSIRADGSVDYAVCGIGMNCNAPDSAFSPDVRELATSLLAQTGRETDVVCLAEKLRQRWVQACDTAIISKTEHMDRYRRDCVTLGRQVRVLGKEPYEATALDVDDDGALVVETGGQMRRVQSGEVSVRGLWGYV